LLGLLKMGALAPRGSDAALHAYVRPDSPAGSAPRTLSVVEVPVTWVEPALARLATVGPCTGVVAMGACTGVVSAAEAYAEEGAVNFNLLRV
jgi:hypothetical protein